MAVSNETKIRYRLFVSGEVHDKEFQKAIVRKANQCSVFSTARDSSNNRLEIILEGEKQAASKVLVWLLKKPRLAKISRLEGDTESLKK